MKKMDSSSIVLGLSSLYYMVNASFRFGCPYKIAVPDNFMRLLDRAYSGSEEHLEFLARIVLEAHQDKEQFSAEVIAGRLYSIFADLAGPSRLILLKEDMVDVEIEMALVGSFKESNYDISLSSKRNFVREYFVKALSWLKKSGALIVETTKSKFVELGEYIVSLQLPEKADGFIENKKEIINRVFSFPGGDFTKWFIGVTISVGGFAHPIFGVIGVGIAFTDP